MMARLAARNVWRYRNKILPIILAQVLVFGVLFYLNAVVSQINARFESELEAKLTGDFVISQRVDGTNFNLFGNDELLIGRYFQQPVLRHSNAIIDALESHNSIHDVTGVVSLLAQGNFNRFTENIVILGVDYGDFAGFFEEAVFKEGSFPAPGESGLVMFNQFSEIVQRLNHRAPGLGDPIVITSSNDNLFTIREAPLSGVYKMETTDEIFARLTLLDIGTARQLADLNNDNADSEPGSTPIASDPSNLDDLFGESDVSDASSEESGGEGSVLDLLGSGFFNPAAQSEINQDFKQGDVHFLLIDAPAVAGVNEIRRILSEAGINADDVLVRGWRDSLGGNFLVLWILQLFINAGLLFILGATVFISGNTLMISVMDRYKEFGTIRAVGGTQRFVSRMVFLEYLVIAVFVLGFGLTFGWLLSQAFAGVELDIANSFIQSLFGGTNLNVRFTAAQALLYAAGYLLLSFAFLIKPMMYVTRVSPVQALRIEA